MKDLKTELTQLRDLNKELEQQKRVTKSNRSNAGRLSLLAGLQGGAGRSCSVAGWSGQEATAERKPTRNEVAVW